MDLGDRSLPMEVLRKASQMGLRTLALPEDLGGVGADALSALANLGFKPAEASAAVAARSSYSAGRWPSSRASSVT